MKSKVFSIIAALLVAIFIISCSKSKNDTLNSSQQTLLSSMKTAYNSAKSYNDSLVNGWAIYQTCTPAMHHCDSLYHTYDATFTNCCTSMGNSGNGMNYNNCNMMNGDNGMMSGNCSYNNPYNDVNQMMIQMCQLRDSHTSYHCH